MPLSDHEQKMLEELERQLFADDPRLARTFENATRPRRDRRRVGLGVLGVVLGLGLLVLSVALPAVWLGVLAFALMVAAGIWAVTAPAQATDGARPAAGPRPVPSTDQQSGSFMRRMEERWDRRGDDRLS